MIAVTLDEGQGHILVGAEDLKLEHLELEQLELEHLELEHFRLEVLVPEDLQQGVQGSGGIHQQTLIFAHSFRCSILTHAVANLQLENFLQYLLSPALVVLHCYYTFVIQHNLTFN